MTKAGPSNPVGRAIYESMFLIAIPFSLFVVKVLYELVPLPVFCLMLAVPIVYFTVSTRYKTQTDEVMTRYRKNISETLVAELEQEETDKLKKRKGGKDKNGAKKNGQSKGKKGAESSEGEGVPSLVIKGGRANQAEEEEDDDYLLQRMADNMARSKTVKNR